MNKIASITLTNLSVFIFFGCSTMNDLEFATWDQEQNRIIEDRQYAKNINNYKGNDEFTNIIYDYIKDKNDIDENIAYCEGHIKNMGNGKGPFYPGFFAHLGLLYSKKGDIKRAVYYLDKEARAFPMSKKYMEFLKSGLKRGAKI